MVGSGKICSNYCLDGALQCLLHAYKQGLSGHAIRLFQNLKLENSLAHLRCLHSILSTSTGGLSSAGGIANHLISFFVLEESGLEASLVFCVLPEPTARAYHGIMSMYGGIQGGACSFELFKRMSIEGIQPNEYTFHCVLKVCGKNRTINEGLLAHDRILCLGFETNGTIRDSLLDMYVKCGYITAALQLFQRFPDHSLIAWSTVIGGCTQNGQGRKALELFQEMEQLHLKPDLVILTCSLNACYNLGLIEEGKLIHDRIIRNESAIDVVVENTLINMYATHGWLEEACNVFKNILSPTVISWGSMLDGYVENGQSACAMAALEQMKHEGARLDKVVYLCAIKACAGLQSCSLGRIVHSQVISSKLDTHLGIKNALISMYGKCGALDEGYKIIYCSEVRDVDLWATMINTSLESEIRYSVTELLARMIKQDVKPNQACLLAILKTCGQLEALLEGRLIHHHIVHDCFDLDPIIGDNVVSMYSYCSSLMDAKDIFYKLQNRTVLSWSAMMVCYSQNAPSGSLPFKELFEKMQVDNIQPDQHLYACILKACANGFSLDDGKWVHNHLITSGVELDAVLGCVLVDLYGRCGELVEACRVFEYLEEKDLVSWGSIIAGCVSQGNHALALSLYDEMRRKGIEPNCFVLSSVLKCCALTGARNQGMLTHDCIIRCSLESDLYIESALINLYVKCECVDEATIVNKASENCNIVSWGALISGYAQGANAKDAMECVKKLEMEGLTPNDDVYARALSACGHAGKVDQAYLCFNSMVRTEDDKFNIKPYNDMADVFARAGYCKEASELLQSLPAPPDKLGWACTYSKTSLHSWQAETLSSNASP